jgi:hypothetical protein
MTGSSEGDAAKIARSILDEHHRGVDECEHPEGDQDKEVQASGLLPATAQPEIGREPAGDARRERGARGDGQRREHEHDPVIGESNE